MDAIGCGNTDREQGADRSSEWTGESRHHVTDVEKVSWCDLNGGGHRGYRAAAEKNSTQHLAQPLGRVQADDDLTHRYNGEQPQIAKKLTEDLKGAGHRLSRSAVRGCGPAGLLARDYGRPAFDILYAHGFSP